MKKSSRPSAVPASIDDYIADCEANARAILKKVRATVRKAAPGAEEVISYRMPAIRYGAGVPVVYYAAMKNHLGLYPTASGIKQFEKEFGKYKWSKGAVQFAFDQPIPYGLITRMVKFRAKECRAIAKAAAKS